MGLLHKMCDTGHMAPKSPSEAGHPTTRIPRMRMAHPVCDGVADAAGGGSSCHLMRRPKVIIGQTIMHVFSCILVPLGIRMMMRGACRL